MSSECVVKIEPEAGCSGTPTKVSQSDLSHGTQNNPVEISPEIVNIKIEVDVARPNEIARIKQEPPDNHYNPPLAQTQDSAVSSTTTERTEWFSVAVASEPPMVVIKEELVEYENESRQNTPSPEPAPQPPATKRTRKSRANTSGDLLNTSSSSDTKFSCPICDKWFANSGNRQRHMSLHDRETYNCDQCSRQFYDKGKLSEHVEKHKQRKFKCDECQKLFNSSSNLQQHKRIHLAVKPYFCENCHRTFAVKANLLKHQGKSRCKRPIDEPLVCKVCDKTFKRYFLLQSHLRRHTTERPFKCDLCDMFFKYKSTLIRHIQLHNGLKPYSCEYCDKTFTHPGLIKPHLRIHTGEKPYMCPVCEKMFAHKHNMQRHMLRHDKVKNLICEVCKKEFPKESRLKYHMKTHISEKHFACAVCPKKFSHRQNILRHYQRKHPNAKYDCTDTDASVALKVWDKVINKKIKLSPNIRNKHRYAEKKEPIIKNRNIEEEAELIVPDIIDRETPKDDKVQTKLEVVEVAVDFQAEDVK